MKKRINIAIAFIFVTIALISAILLCQAGILRDESYANVTAEPFYASKGLLSN